jgi:hypothetical protein
MSLFAVGTVSVAPPAYGAGPSCGDVPHIPSAATPPGPANPTDPCNAVIRPKLPDDALPGPLVYVALGDSYSAGEGAPSVVEDLSGDKRQLFIEGTSDPGNHCHQSLESYPVRTWRALDAQNPNWGIKFNACSGAKSRNLYDDQVFKDGRSLWTPDPQLRDVEDRSADLITMSMGGNDADFAEIVRDCVVEGLLNSTNPLTERFLSACRARWNRTLPDALGDVRAELAQTYQNLKLKLKDGGQLIVVGYPRPFPDRPAQSCGTGLFSSDIDRPTMTWINNTVADGLNAVIREEVEKANRETVPGQPGGIRLRYLDVSRVLTTDTDGQRHDACKDSKDQRWINRILRNHLEWSYHPTAPYHEVVSDMVVACYTRGSCELRER